MKKKILLKFFIVLVISFLMTGCKKETAALLDKNSPVVITLWHSYNSHAKRILDELISEFNDTLGKEEGIIVEAYNYGGASELEDAIYDSVNEIIGSSPTPNILATYPDNAYRINEIHPLVELDKYFSKEEQNEYNSDFLEENIWNGKLKMIPVAKSTEVLYLNKTDWDKFSNDTGCKIEMLETWEGLAEASEKYYQWSDGKPMFGFNPYNNYMSLTAAQLGKTPFVIEGDNFDFIYDKNIAKKTWDMCYIPHMRGFYESNSYCSDGIKSGRLIAYTGSSAGVAFFPKEVTTDYNNTYPIECMILPYPVFEGNNMYMQQRGANMCILESDEAHDFASSVFLKWFTEDEKNLKFTILTGYLPVKYSSLNSIDEINNMIKSLENSENTKKCIIAIINAMEQRSFYANKPYKQSYECGKIFDNMIFEIINKNIGELNRRVLDDEKRDAIEEDLLNDKVFTQWYNELMKQIKSKIANR